MSTAQQQIKDLLEEIANLGPAYYQLQPATELARRQFAARATAHGVPPEVTTQLLDLYAVADNFSYDMTLGFFPCDDELLFEWWAEDKELWLSQRHCDTIRWAGGKFCVGDASNVSFKPADEYATLLELLVGCAKDIKESEAENID